MHDCLAVARDKAMDILPSLLRRRLVEESLKIKSTDTMIFIPLRAAIDPPMGTEITAEDFEDRMVAPSPQSLIKEELEKLGYPSLEVPEKWIRLGSSLIIRLPETSESLKLTLGEIYARIVGVASVYEITGKIKGEFREPEIRLIHGPGGPITHIENGLRYRFDPLKVMFSPGNVHVRTSVRDLDLRGKTILDMFAGIGYFSLGIAKYSSPAVVHACEINPASFDFLKENARLNKVNDIVIPHLGDSRKLMPDIRADVIVMGNFLSFDYLPHAIKRIRNGGTIMMHDIIPSDTISSYRYRIHGRLRDFGWKCSIVEQKTVKSYGPHMWHIMVKMSVHKVN